MRDWASLKILMLGGGSEEASIQAALAGTGRYINPISDRHLPRLSTAVDGLTARRLGVAAGLALPYALWTKMFEPSQVERVTGTSGPPSTRRPRPDRDELYPK